MKSKISLGLIAIIAAVFGVVVIGNEASAASINTAMDACSSWGKTLDRSSLKCNRSHTTTSSTSCTGAGGHETNGNSSEIECTWYKSELAPTSRSEAGTICTSIIGGSWKASEAKCTAAHSNFVSYGSCTSWGGTTAGGNSSEETCQWKSLVAGGDSSDPGSGDDDDDDDDDDDGSPSGGSGGIADVDEGKCSSILPDSWCDSEDGIGNIINLIVTILTGAVVIAGTIGIIICGVMWMTARDNESQVAMAKRRILDIVIGIVAWVLLALLANLFIPKSADKIEEDAGISTTNSKGIEG